MAPRKMRVLIVDDDHGFTDMLKLNLESAGDYAVRIVNDPTRAVGAAEEFLPDVVLLDVIMPRQEGPDVLNALKAHPLLSYIPVVFLTATVTRDDVRAKDGGDIGGRIFLAKPVSLEDLTRCIRHQVRHKFPFLEP